MGRGRGAAAFGRKPGNPVLRVKPAPAMAAVLRPVGGTLAHLVVERAGDRDAVLVMADRRAAIAEAKGDDEE